MVKNLEESYEIVFSSEIYYIKADLKDCLLRTRQKFYLFPAKISDFERVLGDENFERIHRSYLINLERIKSIRTVEQSKLEFRFYDIDDIAISSKGRR